MQQASDPIVKDLVLIGGGHSHAIVLRMLGMKPLPGVRITLITEASDTPYSGMLPGHIAGFYTHDECHIDLRSLASFASAQIYIDRVTGLDLTNKKVLCANRPPVAFDLLSIDIGSTPAKISVPGATEYTIPAKPVVQLLTHWYQLVEQVKQNPQKPICLGIVGGGAGGVELTLSMQSHLQQILKAAQQPRENLEIHLFHRGAFLMPNYNSWVRHRFKEILNQRGVHLHLQETVGEIRSHFTSLLIKCESGLKVECDRIFWVTQASAPEWIQASGLATDADGFIQVDDRLQSISHREIFAAGDIATMVNHPPPKAGVFAVRQGKPLFSNLRSSLLGKPLQPYQPQKQYLSLIGTGDEKAIAAWGAFGFGSSHQLWRWKDFIDRKFMARFKNLPNMTRRQGDKETRGHGENLIQNPKSKIQNQMRCAGCGSKVGSSVLERVLQRIKQEHPSDDRRKDIVIGLDVPDDAAVVQVPAGQLMVHTIDYFRSLINDPFIFGQISANHCLSDIFAMGATPQSALAIATIPYALEAKVEETLYQLLSGALKVLNQTQTPLVGGHTTEGAELSFGLSCNGLVHPDKLLRKGGMRSGQVLIFTKALGTGTLFAAQMRRQAKGRWLDAAIESMLLSNSSAATCLMEHGATACTDITGFGLIGHLVEMVQASFGVAVELKLEAIPVLEGAKETLQKGIFSSLYPENLRAARYIGNLDRVSDRPNFPLLFDPQTSGGLLAAIPVAQASACVNSLQALGYSQSCIIGSVSHLPIEDNTTKDLRHFLSPISVKV
ncbi:MAG TPA: selenide, water dikinase SelD [Cyanobacteria bacterium UBA11049]|nr:selenide, water dikinase SelD [Cyanobacteria bacterium UBA11049]